MGVIMNTKTVEEILVLLSHRHTRFSVTEENSTVNIFVLEKVMVKYAIKEGSLTMTPVNTEVLSGETPKLLELLQENKDILIYSSKLFWDAYNYSKNMYY